MVTPLLSTSTLLTSEAVRWMEKVKSFTPRSQRSLPTSSSPPGDARTYPRSTFCCTDESPLVRSSFREWNWSSDRLFPPPTASQPPPPRPFWCGVGAHKASNFPRSAPRRAHLSSDVLPLNRLPFFSVPATESCRIADTFSEALPTTKV